MFSFYFSKYLVKFLLILHSVNTLKLQTLYSSGYIRLFSKKTYATPENRTWFPGVAYVNTSKVICLPQLVSQALNIQGRMIPLVYGIGDGRCSARVTDYGSVEGAVAKTFHKLYPCTLSKSADDRSPRNQQLFSLFISADYSIPRYLHSLASGVYCDILCDLL